MILKTRKNSSRPKFRMDIKLQETNKFRRTSSRRRATRPPKQRGEREASAMATERRARAHGKRLQTLLLARTHIKEPEIWGGVQALHIQH